MGIKETIISFINKIFKPPISFLDLAIEKLRSIQLVASQGLNVGQYLAVFRDLPISFQLVISSILLSTVLLGSLIIFRSVMRIYYSVKEGVKWW